LWTILGVRRRKRYEIEKTVVVEEIRV